MNSRFISGTFDEYDTKLDELIAWMTNLGINVSPSRIGLYRKSYGSLLEVSRSKNETVAKERFTEFVNTLYEVHELLNIYDGFVHSEVSDHIRDSVQEIAAGPIEYPDESSSNSNKARNTAFELLLTARLLAGGLDAKLTHPADLVCNIGHRRILFECKRPQEESTIFRNVKRANSQLRNRYQSEIICKSRGIVGIDLTKCLVPDRELLKYETESDIESALMSVVDRFSDQYGAKIASMKEKKTIGVVVRISMIAAPSGGAARLVYCQQYGFLTFASSSAKEKVLAVHIGNALKYNHGV